MNWRDFVRASYELNVVGFTVTRGVYAQLMQDIEEARTSLDVSDARGLRGLEIRRDDEDVPAVTVRLPNGAAFEIRRMK